MDFVFVPIGEELARKIGIPVERGVPVRKDLVPQIARPGEFDLATMADSIESYRALHPDDPTYDAFLKTYHHYVGATLANQERVADALEHFERALALDPGDHEVRADLARAAFDVRHLDRALELYRELADRGQASLENLEAMARIHLSMGEPAKALVAAEEARTRFPGSWESANLLSTIYYHNRDVAKLESALHEQLALDPANVLTLEKLAVYYRECARHSEARTCIDRALRLDPARTRLRYQSAMIHMGMGRNTDAEAEFQQALRLEEDHLDTLNGLGVLYMIWSRPKEARRCLARAVAVAPRDYRGPLNLGRLCFTLKGEGRQEALDWFRRALELGMDDGAALETVVIAARELGDEDLARRADRMLARVGRAGAASRPGGRAEQEGGRP